MTILVTGGAGYIGGQMVIFVLDDLSSGVRAAVPTGVSFLAGDVGDIEVVSKAIRDHKVDTIFHFAAKIVVAESIVDPLVYYLNNTVKTRALLEAAVQENVRYFVFSSTAAVYGNPKSSPVSEDAVPMPLSPYGSSKLMSEQILRDASAAYGLKHAILRYFNVAGADPGGRHGQRSANATHLIKVALETALGRRTHMSIYGDDYPTIDGTCVRDYVHVSDLANAHVTALEHLRHGGDSCVLNCGYGRGYSVREVVDTVKIVAGVDFQVQQGPRRGGDPASIIANSDRLMRMGWKPAFDALPTMIRHAYDWERGR
jgi:UDP-glucose 4-epimerase